MLVKFLPEILGVFTLSSACNMYVGVYGNCFQASFYRIENVPESVLAGSLPRTPLRMFTALSQAPSRWERAYCPLPRTTTGCLTLLLKIYWNYFFPAENLLEIYKVSWKFSGLVCEFEHLSLTLATILVFQSVSVQNNRGKRISIDIEVSNLVSVG